MLKKKLCKICNIQIENDKRKHLLCNFHYSEYMREYRKKHPNKNKEIIKKYRKKNIINYMESQKKTQNKYKKLNAHKIKAHTILNIAIKKGQMKRPKKCEHCGGGGIIHGHHENYKKPLDVIWLCVNCHNEVHNKYSDLKVKL